MADTVDLMVGLRSLLDPVLIQVWWAPREDAASAIEELAPWPWGIVETASPCLDTGQVRAAPVLRWWLGTPPSGLAQARAHTTWLALAEDIAARLDRSVGGLKLAGNRGVRTEDGGLLLAPELEALLSSWPDPVPCSARAAARLTGILTDRGLPVSIVKENGGFALREDR